jgi:hypothetical protein
VPFIELPFSLTNIKFLNRLNLSGFTADNDSNRLEYNNINHFVQANFEEFSNATLARRGTVDDGRELYACPPYENRPRFFR